MLSDGQYYVRHLMPVRQLWCMMMAGGVDTTKRTRKLALSAGRHWWHDTEHTVWDRTSFVKALQSDWTPLQLHLDTLELRDGPSRYLVRHERELVLDMDLTDPRFRRFCACASAPPEEKRVCSECWMLVEGASLLLGHLLEQLGVAPQNMLWVWSGRKGVHCVVNDRWAMRMQNEERERLQQWLERPASLPEWRERVDQLDPTFLDELIQLCERRVIQRRRQWHNESFRLWAQQQTRDTGRPAPTWNDLTRDTAALLVLQLYWPAVDAGPLRHNHLYKAPFSVHPETQCVSLPLSLVELQDDALPRHPLTLRALCEMHRGSQTLPECFVAGCKRLADWTTLYG